MNHAKDGVVKDPFVDRSNKQLYREAQVWMAVFTCLLAVFLYLVVKRMSGSGEEIPEHILRSGVAQVVANSDRSQAGRASGFPNLRRPSLGLSELLAPKSFEGVVFESPGPNRQFGERDRRSDLARASSFERIDSSDLKIDSQARKLVPENAFEHSDEVFAATVAGASKIETKGERRARELAMITSQLPERLEQMRSTVQQATAILPNENNSRVEPVSAFEAQRLPKPQLVSRQEDNAFEMSLPSQVNHSKSTVDDSGFVPTQNNPQQNTHVLFEQILAKADSGQTVDSNQVEQGLLVSAADSIVLAAKQPGSNVVEVQNSRITAEEIGGEFSRELRRPKRLRPSKLAATPMLSHIPTKVRSSFAASHQAAPVIAKSQVDIAESLKGNTEASLELVVAGEVTRPVARPNRKSVPSKPGVAKSFQKTHDVTRGDSFFSVAQEHYQDGRWFHALYLANKDKVEGFDSLSQGMQLTIPSLATLAQRYPKFAVKDTFSDRSSNSIRERIYVTKEQDSLFDIARRKLGQGSRYVEIIELNEIRLPKETGASERLPLNLRLVLPVTHGH